ncbi:MAG TPA: hypothetical protein IGS17_15165 [Oscillatoriales cyanobacterium M59_W2019_021]|nr:hypothetical protein [Oscillatoriales cyanobacterium M4454_W2019_049]HIK52246.1 hypothetical protein [Oscillatoriales cyanobacterium M59_W2019_021]
MDGCRSFAKLELWLANRDRLRQVKSLSARIEFFEYMPEVRHSASNDLE